MLSLKPKESSARTHRVKMSQVTDRMSLSRREETGSCFCAASWGWLLKLGSGGAGLTQVGGLCWERRKGPNSHHLGVLKVDKVTLSCGNKVQRDIAAF